MRPHVCDTVCACVTGRREFPRVSRIRCEHYRPEALPGLRLSAQFPRRCSFQAQTPASPHPHACRAKTRHSVGLADVSQSASGVSEGTAVSAGVR